MEQKYFKQTKPFRVPTIDNKLIEEHFGLASTRTGNFSIAHMVAPPHWSEPHQKPEFDEITIVIRGRKQIEVDGDIIELAAGETLLVKAGARVKYSNPFDEETEYWSVCVPAFDISTVHREGE
ncbi:cupin domain-containing protein [Adhaeribacter radiodurans]|uniref:Cupin domain-containing protein n=1 Tax=Adhaeribacter radiodurans TaxID=2745197 RepID=A0A7L7L3M5_9BACT|nr:cupin domain-containing protein [Adhaeribacter radiodurans]QMU27408.1 cupin domain-containing protein [Adhaeribacter radiodurans]